MAKFLPCSAKCFGGSHNIPSTETVSQILKRKSLKLKGEILYPVRSDKNIATLQETTIQPLPAPQLWLTHRDEASIDFLEGSSINPRSSIRVVDVYLAPSNRVPISASSIHIVGYFYLPWLKSQPAFSSSKNSLQTIGPPRCIIEPFPFDIGATHPCHREFQVLSRC